MNSAEVWGMILAAGSGSRLRDACGMAKQYLYFQGFPLYWHSVMAFARVPQIKGIVLVFPPLDCARERERIAGFPDVGIILEIAAGGSERIISATRGLEKIPLSCARVLIHDAARPFIKPCLIKRVLNALDGSCQGVVPAIKVTDTIKILEETESCMGIRTLPREQLRAAQTPQGFETAVLRGAYRAAEKGQTKATDDASLLESMGYKVCLVDGEEDNIKITWPGDLKKLHSVNDNFPCTGFGYDVHRFGGNRPLKLGGISIPCDLAVHAHSDGDVVLHALMDALLSIACAGDIGMHFSDADPQYEGISSAVLLDDVLKLIREKGIGILLADITIVAQKPRISSWREDIRNNLARLLDLPRDRVNVKATTEEGLGFTGRAEGIKAYALVSALRRA